jgi:hypothetical protein
MRKLFVRLLPAVLLALQATTPASAAWSVSGDGASRAAAGTLEPPTGPAVVVGCGDYSTVAFRDSRTATEGLGSVTVNRPSLVTAGDVLVAQIAQGASAVFTPSSTGWTEVVTNTRGTLTATTYWRLATASEPSSYSWSSSVTNVVVLGGVAAYSGVSAATPVDASDGATGNGATLTAPSVQASIAGGRLLGLFALRNSRPSVASGTEQRWSFSNLIGSAVAGISMGDTAVTAVGPTGALTATGTAADWIGQTVVLRPQGVPRATVSWASTPSTFADGYEVVRTGGGTSSSSTVSGRTTTSLLQAPLAKVTTYSWTVRARAGAWASAATTAVEATTGSC